MGILDLAGEERRAGLEHFMLPVPGRRIAYCYIRKTGCSAFKRLFLALSPHAPTPRETPLRFMIRHHRATADEVAAAEVRICILRDPVARIVSVYRNKFVQRAGHEDLFASYAKLALQDPDEASFRDFVGRYLVGNRLRKLDPHVWPQDRHLLAVTYNAAFLLEDLRSGMAGVLGDDAAARFFTERENATSGFPTRDGDLSAAPSAELHRHFVAFGGMPSDAALCDVETAGRLRALYAADLRLLGRLGPG